MTNDYRIRFGTVGWQHEQWQDDFYPQDLPEDWLLPFYGNEFPVVAVPASTWSDDPAAQIEEWLDNSDDHFRFIFEWPWTTADDLHAFCQQLEPIQAKSAGILLQVPWSVCCQDSDLSTALHGAPGEIAICLELMQDDGVSPVAAVDFTQANFSTLLSNSGVSCCWHGTEDKPDNFFRSRFAVTKIIDTAVTARQIRHVLEVCSAQVQSHDDMVVLFAGNPPALNKVREAMVMLELLA